MEELKMKTIKSLVIFLTVSALLSLAPLRAMEKEEIYTHTYFHERDDQAIIQIPSLFELATLVLLKLYALDNQLLDSHNHIKLLLGNKPEIGIYQLPKQIKIKIRQLLDKDSCLRILEPLLPKSYRPCSSNQIFMLQEEIGKENLDAVGQFFNNSSASAILALLTAQKQRNNREPIDQKLFDLIAQEGSSPLQALGKQLASGEYDQIICGKSVFAIPRKGDNRDADKTICTIS
jgi:hypothetical protein